MLPLATVREGSRAALHLRVEFLIQLGSLRSQTVIYVSQTEGAGGRVWRDHSRCKGTPLRAITDSLSGIVKTALYYNRETIQNGDYLQLLRKECA
jgi:hypothetical protein